MKAVSLSQRNIRFWLVSFCIVLLVGCVYPISISSKMITPTLNSDSLILTKEAIVQPPTSIDNFPESLPPAPPHPSKTNDPMIIFTSTVDGDRVLYTLRPDGTHLQRLLEKPRISYSPVWSPDGDRLAFLGGESPDTIGLYIRDWESAELRSVDQSGVKMFAWAPDNIQLAFAYHSGVRDYIAIVNTNTFEVIKVANIDQDLLVQNIKWSPDGGRLLTHVMPRKAGSGFLYFFSLTQQGFERVGLSGNIWDADWSPDSEWLAFAEYNFDTAQSTIVLLPTKDLEQIEEILSQKWVDRQDENLKIITSTVSQESSLYTYLKWSPDGEKLVACRDSQNTYCEIIIPRSGKVETIPIEVTTAYFSWSPDSQYLAFVGNSTPKSLYTYSIQSNDSFELIKGMVDDSLVAWKP